MSKADILKKIHREIDHFDEYVALGVISRLELTEAILHRHILSAKYAMQYFMKNLHQANDSNQSKENIHSK